MRQFCSIALSISFCLLFTGGVCQTRIPERLWGTYYGDAGPDYSYSVVVDKNDNVIIAGYTLSTNNISSGGAYQTSNGGSYDVFVSKFNSSGTRLWATYFGGTDIDKALSVAVDKAGCIYVTGATTSTTAIASTGSQQTVYGGGIDDAFLVKFDPNGKRRWATYFGGTQHDFSNCVALDDSANVIITGHTESPTGIATSGAIKSSFGGKSDVFIAKYDSAGALRWATYYGDSGFEEGSGVVCDAAGNIFVTGFTESTINFSTNGTHQPVFGGPSDAYLMKVNPACSLLWCTYYGGSGIDQGWGIACDGIGNIYITGNTSSNNNIASSNAYQPALGSADDAFVVKFRNGGSRAWGTYFGGNDLDYSYGMALNKRAELFISGYTSSSNVIATANAYLPAQCGNSFDAFVQKFDSSGVRKWGSYYGASGYDESRGASVDSKQFIYICGSSSSNDSIASTGSHQALKGGGYDGMLVKFCEPPAASILSQKDTICKDDVLNLASGGTHSSYSWSTGSTNSSISVSGLSAGNYTFTLTVTDSVGCPALVKKVIVVDPCTGIAEKNVGFLRLYPNPAAEELNLEFIALSPGSLELFSITGQCLHTESLLAGAQHKKITLRNYPQGLYFIRLRLEDAVYVRRFTLDVGR